MRGDPHARDAARSEYLRRGSRPLSGRDACMSRACLTVELLHGCYGGEFIFCTASRLRCRKSGVVALLGRNGAGKTTALRSLMKNLVRPRAGTITFRGTDITGRATYAIVRLGMTLVPEHRGVFSHH